MSTVQHLPYDRLRMHDEVDELLAEIRRLVARRDAVAAAGRSPEALDARLAWLRGRLARTVSVRGPDFDDAA